MAVDKQYKENIIIRVWRVLRREFYLRFRKIYVREQLKKRKGHCKGCGCCIMATPQCKHFNSKTGECIIWKTKGFDAMPLDCKIYPFDEQDKILFAKKNCGYHWEEER